MGAYDRGLARLMQYLYLFAQGKRLTRDELCEEFNISGSQVYRDMGYLKYYPIVQDQYKRYHFDEGYGLDKSVLETDEMFQLMLSLSLTEDIDEAFSQRAQSIIKKLVVHGFASPYYIKPEQYEDFDTDSDIANLLEDAIKQSRVTEIHYKNQEHLVEPYRISNFDGLWYLFAKDLSSGKTRTYDMKYIKDANMTGKKFKSVNADELLQHVHSAWYEDGNCFTVTIKVSNEIAPHFKRKKHLTTQTIEKEYDDGSLFISFEVSHDEDIDNLIKAWLPHVEVIQPKRMRNRLAAELKTYLAQLEKSPEIDI